MTTPKTTINAIKVGKIINLWLNGKLRKKVCETNDSANELFGLILKVKDKPTQDGVNQILGWLNEKTRIAMQCGLETDPDTGCVYLAGFNTAVPQTLVDVIKEYHENKFPMEAILNFWKLLMINPDVRVRESLFDFINTHDFVLTDTGYMIVYKAVSLRENNTNDELKNFIVEANEKVTVKWGTTAKRYVVYLDLTTHVYRITKTITTDKWDLKTKEVEILGNLAEMFKDIDTVTKLEQDTYPYTDKYSKKMKIRIGEPVKQERRLCDGNPSNECSNGLHVGATKYVEKFGAWYSGESRVLVCYVNPAHVVAVPEYDNSKMRVSEYFPFSEINYDEANQKIEVIEQSYFESDYSHYEKEELAEMVTAIQKEESPIEMAKGIDEDDRSLAELKKLIENRMVVISK